MNIERLCEQCGLVGSLGRDVERNLRNSNLIEFKQMATVHSIQCHTLQLPQLISDLDIMQSLLPSGAILDKEISLLVFAPSVSMPVAIITVIASLQLI